VVEQIAQEYVDQPVLFLEYDVDNAPYSRKSRYYASDNEGSILPFVIVDSGNQASNGSVDFETVYTGMVDSAQIRPPQAEINAVWQRVGDKVKFFVDLTNSSDVSLSSDNSATIHAIVYEETKVQETGRFVRTAVSTSIQNHSPNVTKSYELETSDLMDVSWSRLHYVVLVDYRPAGLTGPYDMLQAVIASPKSAPIIVTIDQGLNQIDPTDAVPIAFDVVFSKPVEGFTEEDVEISGTAPGDKTVVIQGSGSNYTVYVRGMTGSGTVIASIPAGAAVDSFGNRNLASTSIDNVVTYIDPNPKVIEIRRFENNPTNLAEVKFVVNFSEAVNEVDRDDFDIHTTGDLSNVGINFISGSGSSRMVSVSTGIGSGTIRLDVSAKAVIVDAQQNKVTNIPFVDGEAYTVRVESFTDVVTDHWAWEEIEQLFTAGVTQGCGGTTAQVFCPDLDVTRAEMVKFILVAVNGAGYTPTADVTEGTSFDDVDEDYWAAAWIEQLYQDGLTNGCNQAPLQFCPDAKVTRAEMAKFLLPAMNVDELDYEPDEVGVSSFTDIPATYWAIDWIEALYDAGVTTGCSQTPLKYCPESNVTRAEMAVFLVRAFELP